MEFKSEISYSLVIGIAIFLFAATILTLQDSVFTREAVIVLIVQVLIICFLWYILNSIKYTIKGDILEVKDGVFYKKEISIRSIEAIEKTGSLLSSPAASLTKRILLKCENYTVIISPENRKEFLKILQGINPNIKINNGL